MKQLEYLYFNIYTHCSKRSFYPGDLYVRLRTMYLLCLSAGGWILLLQASFLRLIRHSWFSSQSSAMMFAMSVYLVIGFIFHRIFIVNEHDQKIFNKYAQSWDSNPNKKRDLLLSVLVTVIPYLLLLSLKLFFSRPQ
jgi:hypothetical protein